jgi:predicted AAA+ superfamily ATPase
MIITRNIGSHLQELGQYYPIVSLTGPRQAGKTTLLQDLYPDYTYISLEDPDVRDKAQQDPRSFLKKYNNHVIFDDAQRVPELFSYLQTIVDRDKQVGQFILSGSQNFLLRKNITQSLAGRVGIARLFPLDNQELKNAGLLPLNYEDIIHKGYYPALFNLKIPPRLFYPSYEYSYIERDVTGLISAKNLETFRLFVRLCASKVSQNINYSEIAKSAGVSVNTIKSWFSILEQSYIIFRLPPYFKNFGKRLVKSPKLYFYDTGLLCHLLEIEDPNSVADYHQLGALFENLIMANRIKETHHKGKTPRFYFYRDNNQLEVDLFEETPNGYVLTEIKSTRTFRSDSLKGLYKLDKIIDRPTKKRLIYGGEENFEIKDVDIASWADE